MQAPVWRPLALSKERVTRGVGLLNLLHFAKDTAQQTNRVLTLLVDKNIHYRILKLLYGARNQRWNMRAYLRYVPVVYGVWHAYKFVITQTFRVFWPILTYLRKGLLRPGSTILSCSKLIVMEKAIAALMLATPRILRLYCPKAQAATAISGRDTAHANRAAVANAVLHLLSEWCPLLLYLGHLVRECNWSGENNGTGARAQEVLQLSWCLLRWLRRGPCDTVLKYERTIMCTLLYNSKWHQDLLGQAHSDRGQQNKQHTAPRPAAPRAGNQRTLETMGAQKGKRREKKRHRAAATKTARHRRGGGGAVGAAITREQPTAGRETQTRRERTESREAGGQQSKQHTAPRTKAAGAGNQRTPETPGAQKEGRKKQKKTGRGGGKEKQGAKAQGTRGREPKKERDKGGARKTTKE